MGCGAVSLLPVVASEARPSRRPRDGPVRRCACGVSRSGARVRRARGAPARPTTHAALLLSDRDPTRAHAPRFEGPKVRPRADRIHPAPRARPVRCSVADSRGSVARDDADAPIPRAPPRRARAPRKAAAPHPHPRQDSARWPPRDPHRTLHPLHAGATLPRAPPLPASASATYARCSVTHCNGGGGLIRRRRAWWPGALGSHMREDGLYRSSLQQYGDDAHLSVARGAA